MIVIVNGKKLTVASQQLVDVICQFNAKAPFAIAINGEFVAQADYQKTLLKEGDLIDIVSPIFGG
ncbi:sulfur carrier protein ThiS [Thalassotalea ganghwensis]